MTQSFAKTSSRLRLLAIFLSAASVGFGAISQCDNVGPTGSLISTISAATSVTNGCANIDKSFSEWTVGGTAPGGTVTTANVDYLASGSVNTAAAAGAIAGTVSMTFNPSVASAWEATLAQSGTYIGTVNYIVQANTGGTFTGGSYTKPGNAAFAWDITGLNLGAVGSMVSGATAGNSLDVLETFCIGSTTTAGCAAANTGHILASMSGTGTLTSFTFSCATGVTGSSCNGGNTGITFGPVAEIAISEVFTLTRVNGTTVFLTDFVGGFVESMETPEPTSFLLLGTGLLGAGIWRFRRYKKA